MCLKRHFIMSKLLGYQTTILSQRMVRCSNTVLDLKSRDILYLILVSRTPPPFPFLLSWVLFTSERKSCTRGIKCIFQLLSYARGNHVGYGSQQMDLGAVGTIVSWTRENQSNITDIPLDFIHFFELFYFTSDEFFILLFHIFYLE